MRQDSSELLSKEQWKGKDKKKTENQVIDDERGLQQVEGQSWTLRRMASLDVRTRLGRQEEQEEDFQTLNTAIEVDQDLYSPTELQNRMQII